ncbi:hypothetical protein EUGRSUZ_D00258, partial [Eucalyptus grandis]
HGFDSGKARSKTAMASRAARALLSLPKRKPNVLPSPLLRPPAPARGLSSSPEDKPANFGNVGFIGLGNMGSRMAKNLVKAGYNVAVHDINGDAMKIFAGFGVPTKKTPFEVAEESDVKVTMLPSSSHVFDVYTGPNGLLHGGNLLRPWLSIDSSTIDPQTSRKISALVSNCTLNGKKDGGGVPMMLGTPVSGGVLAAEAGSLTFMVGGSEEAYLTAKRLLLAMGKSTIYCGGAGNGSAAKICNNLAMAASMLGVSEALALGQVFNSSSARCWSSDAYNPVPGVMEGVPSSRNYDGGFATKLMAKDLNLAKSSAEEVGVKCPLTFQAQDIYSGLCKEGHESKDFSCVFRHYYSGIDEQKGK